MSRKCLRIALLSTAMSAITTQAMLAQTELAATEAVANTSTQTPLLNTEPTANPRIQTSVLGDQNSDEADNSISPGEDTNLVDEIEEMAEETAKTESQTEQLGKPIFVEVAPDPELELSENTESSQAEPSNAQTTSEVEGSTVTVTSEIEENINSEKIKDFTPLINAAQASALTTEIETLLGAPIEGITSGEQEALQAFYEARFNKPYFILDEAANNALDRALSLVNEEGLPPARYEMPETSGDMALAELHAAAQFLRYSRDMEQGMINPRSLGKEFDLSPQGRSYDELLTAYISSSDKNAFMQDLAPNDLAYPIMKKELAKLHSVMGENIEEPIIVPTGLTLKLEVSSPNVALLRDRLKQLGFDAGFSAEPNMFDLPLETQVKSYQAAAGLSDDGVVGPATLNVLNTGPKDHLRKVLIGMERLRWGSSNVSGRQIHVNLANFTAQVRDDNQKTFETIVVVGKNDPQYRTPEFNDTMTHLIVNPKWNVPQSISVKEYLPKIQRDPGYLARNNITMRIKGSGQVVSPKQIDMSQFTVNDFPFLLQQQEGDGNALGNVKFMFPNSHNIYLHDTPSKSLFARSIRTFSHGCVRVRDPEDLATTLLSRQYDDPRGTYKSFLNSGRERQVNFETAIPVHLTYFTAYPNDNGTISYASDSYGRDQILAKALREKGLEL